MTSDGRRGASTGAGRGGRPRLRDVARSLGVSVTTVSNAFNRPDQLSDELRWVVLRRSEEMGYRGPGAEGRLLRTGHAGAVALYIPEPMAYLIEDAFARAFLAALADACQERQVGLLLLPAVPHERADRPRLPAALDVAAVDAIILYALADDDPVIERAIGRGRPVVGIDLRERPGLVRVGVDDRGGAAAAARHLIARGHRRFGVIALPTSRTRADRGGTPTDFAHATIEMPAHRWTGYADAFAEAGIDPNAVAIRIAGVNARPNGRAAMMALLDRAPDERPTAILTMSDELARGAIETAADLGLAVPDDVAVVGFDDASFAAAIGLTMVTQDAGAKARLALQSALGEEGGGTLPTKLVVRATCR